MILQLDNVHAHYGKSHVLQGVDLHIGDGELVTLLGRNGGGQLSGGEQQMLAIGRALMNDPKLLMLDEPVEGLAPVIVEEIVAQLKLIRSQGVAILLVEQNLEVCTQLADRHCILEQGRIVYTASNAAFMVDEEVKDRYLGVGLV